MSDEQKQEDQAEAPDTPTDPDTAVAEADGDEPAPDAETKTEAEATEEASSSEGEAETEDVATEKDEAVPESDTSEAVEDEAAEKTKEADAADTEAAESDEEEEETDHAASIEELLKAGAHFGHLTSRWHPRMEPYIFMDRNNIHIIDLMQTQVMLDEAADAARRFARRGKTILFAGTKKQAQDILREHAESCDMPHMVNRWLGGTMTNFETIRRSIRRMEEIERMERDGTLDKLKKKEKLVRLREHEKLENVLGGIREMAHLPGAIFIVDVKRERIAVNEARKLGIPIIAIADTNCDPKKIDYPVPANDDALSSIELITSIITDAIKEGQKEHQMKQEARKKKQQS